MIVNDDGSVSGSLDRAQLAELHTKAKTKALKVYYRELLGDSEEGQAADAPAEPEPEKPAAKKTASKGDDG